MAVRKGIEIIKGRAGRSLGSLGVGDMGEQGLKVWVETWLARWCGLTYGLEN